ncbi:hypothetical protein O181_111031 [Austropuccinia psidii MF-1]|uniref:Uncharacterized protein n=1 Tax=Austropuccinia psidii MF-1 TaxID=1389203 RepID=A0A9Q3K0C1_9BASI|nr:hypothetical protein [Austropuccinia psidii MF-1]
MPFSLIEIIRQCYLDTIQLVNPSNGNVILTLFNRLDPRTLVGRVCLDIVRTSDKLPIAAPHVLYQHGVPDKDRR